MTQFTVFRNRLESRADTTVTLELTPPTITPLKPITTVEEDFIKETDKPDYSHAEIKIKISDC
jgi:hypothetical protein